MNQFQQIHNSSFSLSNTQLNDNLNQVYNQNINCSNSLFFNIGDAQDFCSAASIGDLKLVMNFLKKQNCNVNMRSDSGWTPLMYAAHYGHYNVIKVLLDHGANSNLKEYVCGKSALMLAASNGHTRCIEMLVSQGKADIRLKDMAGNNAAYYATHYGHGSNKIIARLLGIRFNNQVSSNSSPNVANNKDNILFVYNNRNNLLNNINGNIYNNNEEIDLNQLNYYSSLNDKKIYSNNNTNDNLNQLNTSDLSLNNFTSNNRQAKNSKPRAIFKLRNTRRSSIELPVENKENKQTNLIGNFNGSNTLLNQQLFMPTRSTSNLSIENDNHFSPEQVYIPKNVQYSTQFDTVFNSPSPDRMQSFSNNDKTNRFDGNYFNYNFYSNENEIMLRKISTLNSHGSGNSDSSDSNLFSSPEESFLTNANSIDQKFSDLANSLEEFLSQIGLLNLYNIFKEKDIELYNFLSLSEFDFKQLGITNLEKLAVLIAAQLKFRETIGIQTSEQMNFVTFLGNKLEKAKKEIAYLKMVNQELKLNELSSKVTL